MTTWIGRGVDGALVPDEDALVSASDHGYTVGDGIFETMKCVDGRIFLWSWHLERLSASADRLGLRLPPSDNLTHIVHTVGNSVGAGVSRVRLTISAGSAPLSSDRGDGPVTVVCASSAAPVRRGDAVLHLARWPRNEQSPLAGIKSTSYAEQVLALAEARAAGADEAVFRNTRGYLCEGTASNVFIVSGGTAFTPPVEAGVLAGVTRRFVLSLADAGLPVLERNILFDEFLAADEAFITSTFQDVRGVRNIGGRELVVGAVTRELKARFAAAADLPQHWS